MNLFKTLKCILVLVKCSKYLYIMKKTLFIATLLLGGVFALGLFTDKKSLICHLGIKK